MVAEEVEKLEIRFLANRDANLFFALLSDFTDSPEPVQREDPELLEAAKEGITRLNARYRAANAAERFLLFHRRRTWSDSERMWIGRERKRGKIEDLNDFLSGHGSDEILVVGGLPLPIRYVITLDSDTQLPPGTARRMVETISHPLNRAEIDPEKRIRLRGFSIIQPRVSIGLPGIRPRDSRACSRILREPIPIATPYPIRSRIYSAKPFFTARQFTTCRRFAPFSKRVSPRKLS